MGAVSLGLVGAVDGRARRGMGGVLVSEAALAAQPAPFGFLLVTTDPRTTRGTRGTAWKLVQHRLAQKRWPLYANTRNRRAVAEGARIAFYVGGRRKFNGMVVATAIVDRKAEWSSSKGPIDPDVYVTDLADQVLFLRAIAYLEEPVLFRRLVDRMTFRPSNPQRWGVVLMGGCRSLQLADWRWLFGE